MDYSKPPVIFIPGCASNAHTFDVDASDGFSMPRLCAEKLNREVWICESRGVGHARNHETPLESYTKLVMEEDIEDEEQYDESDQKKSQTKKKIIVSVPKIKPTIYGGWDFDTYVLDDLPTAFTYIRNLMVNEGRAQRDTFEYDLIGHSMGGMLACAVAARSQHEHPGWSIRKVIAFSVIVRMFLDQRADGAVHLRTIRGISGAFTEGFNRRRIRDTENTFTVTAGFSRHRGTVHSSLGPTRREKARRRFESSLGVLEQLRLCDDVLPWCHERKISAKIAHLWIR